MNFKNRFEITQTNKYNCSVFTKEANRIAVFKKINQLDWNHKPICEISKVCVNLIPNHNPES